MTLSHTTLLLRAAKRAESRGDEKVRARILDTIRKYKQGRKGR